jgi:pimeloyl-ACP methyl ester carboxylesterase
VLALDAGRRACDVADVASVSPRFNRPVRSRVPALVLGDDYDPVTPPADGRRAARTLTNAFVVDTHGLGHTPALATDCTRGILRAFLDAPRSRPDTTCADQMTGPAWVPP